MIYLKDKSYFKCLYLILKHIPFKDVFDSVLFMTLIDRDCYLYFNKDENKYEVGHNIL